jgi:hypothetical protein
MPGHEHVDVELVAEELARLSQLVNRLHMRLAAVERVNGRLETAALVTNERFGEIARHWGAVYEAMKLAEAEMDQAVEPLRSVSE